MGPGLLESIYEEALCHELFLRSIPFERQKEVDVFYKPKKGDLPQRAQRKFEIKQEDKLLFSALLCALVK